MEHSGKLRKVGVELLWRALTFWRWVIAEDNVFVEITKHFWRWNTVDLWNFWIKRKHS